MPALSVRRNVSSSPIAARRMRSNSASSSGYAAFIASLDAVKSSAKTGRSTPSKRMERTVLRSNLRRT